MLLLMVVVAPASAAQVIFGWLDSYGEVGTRPDMLGGHVLLHKNLAWPTIDTLPTSGWAGAEQLQEVREWGDPAPAVHPVAVIWWRDGHHLVVHAVYACHYWCMQRNPVHRPSAATLYAAPCRHSSPLPGSSWSLQRCSRHQLVSLGVP